MLNNYLSKEVLIENIPNFNINVDDLISADSYNETKLLNTYKSYKREDQELLFKAAVQIAIIGCGQRNYGSVRLNENNIISLVEIFNKLNIKYNKGINEKYKDDEFSVRRLSRFFRYQVQEFIIKSQRPSYLWLKYSDNNQKYAIICFPGSEHMVETKDEALYLLRTYYNLDVIQNTNFIQRLKRIFITRKIYLPLEIDGVISEMKVKK